MSSTASKYSDDAPLEGREGRGRDSAALSAAAAGEITIALRLSLVERGLLAVDAGICVERTGKEDSSPSRSSDTSAGREAALGLSRPHTASSNAFPPILPSDADGNDIRRIAAASRGVHGPFSLEGDSHSSISGEPRPHAA